MKLVKLVSISLLMICFSLAGYAQFDNENQGKEKISDQELKEFAAMQAKIQELNRETQQVMGKEIEKNNMTIQRYQEISQAKNSGNEPEMTSEEASNFEKASSAVEEQHAKMQKKMDKEFESSSISKQRYIQINKQLSNDQDLQKRLRELQE